MSRPFLLVQLSDPHVGASWGGDDPIGGLAAAVEAVRALEPSPDGVLLSGDLAEHAADGEYEAPVAPGERHRPRCEREAAHAERQRRQARAER